MQMHWCRLAYSTLVLFKIFSEHVSGVYRKGLLFQIESFHSSV